MNQGDHIMVKSFFRIHQFEKIEQFVIATPEGNASWELMEEMLGNAEAFYQVRGGFVKLRLIPSLHETVY